MSLLPNTVTGLWLASRSGDVRGDLLDVGAGNQPFRPWYATLVNSVVAIDATPAEGLDLLAFASKLPFPDRCFDTVLCTSVLEHVENAEAAVAEIARVVRPGGRLLVSVPFLYPTHEAPYDFWRTTHHGLRSLLERHGFEVEDVSAIGGPCLLVAHYLLGGLAQMLLILARLLGPLGGLIDNRVVRGALSAPQLWLRPLLGYRLTRSSRAVSLGYMASGYKR